MNPSGGRSSHSRRSSILKLPKQCQTTQSTTVSNSSESSPTVKLKRRVSFAEKKHVKEFCNSAEQGTVWDKTYEEHDLSQLAGGNLSNEMQCDTRTLNRGNRIVSEPDIYMHSLENKVEFCVEASLKPDNYEIMKRVEAYKHLYHDVGNSQLLTEGSNCNNDMPIEFTQVIAPACNAQSSRYISVCEYIHELPAQHPMSALLKDVSNTLHTSNDNINEHPIEFTTPIASALTATRMENELHKENVTPEHSKTKLQDISMDFTPPITARRGKDNQNSIRRTLLHRTLKFPKHDGAETKVSNDVSMNISSACHLGGNHSKTENDATEICSTATMQMTTAIKHCPFRNEIGLLKTIKNLEENGRETITEGENKTPILENYSMTITTAISSTAMDLDKREIRNTESTIRFNDESIEMTNAIEMRGVFATHSVPKNENYGLETHSEASKPFNSGRSNSGACVDMSMEMTRAVTQNILNRPNANVDNENGPTTISTAVEGPNLFPLYSMPNKENCNVGTYNETSRICTPAEKNFAICADMSMEMTRPVTRNILKTGNAVFDEENDAIERSELFAPHSMRNNADFGIEIDDETSRTCNVAKKNFAVPGDMSMEMTRAVPQNVFHRPSAFVDKENEPINPAIVIERPGLLPSHSMGNHENFGMKTHNETSRTCNLTKNFAVSGDMSMEITRAVTRNIFNRPSAFVDKENEPINPATVMERPGLLPSHSMGNHENFGIETHNETSRTCNLTKNFAVSGDMSMEMTRAVTRNILNRPSAFVDKENEPINPVTAMARPGLLPSHSMGNHENFAIEIDDETSRTCNLAKKNFVVSGDMSMEMTRAVTRNILNRPSAFVDKENEPINPATVMERPGLLPSHSMGNHENFGMETHNETSRTCNFTKNFAVSGDMSMEMTRAVTRNILNRPSAFVDKENQPINPATIMERPGLLPSHSMGNHENFAIEIDDETSRTCNLAKKNFAVFGDMSMEMTRAVPQNVFHRPSAFVDKDNEPINPATAMERPGLLPSHSMGNHENFGIETDNETSRTCNLTKNFAVSGDMSMEMTRAVTRNILNRPSAFVDKENEPINPATAMARPGLLPSHSMGNHENFAIEIDDETSRTCNLAKKNFAVSGDMSMEMTRAVTRNIFNRPSAFVDKENEPINPATAMERPGLLPSHSMGNHENFGIETHNTKNFAVFGDMSMEMTRAVPQNVFHRPSAFVDKGNEPINPATAMERPGLLPSHSMGNHENFGIETDNETSRTCNLTKNFAVSGDMSMEMTRAVTRNIFNKPSALVDKDNEPINTATVMERPGLLPSHAMGNRENFGIETHNTQNFAVPGDMSMEMTRAVPQNVFHRPSAFVDKENKPINPATIIERPGLLPSHAMGNPQNFGTETRNETSRTCNLTKNFAVSGDMSMEMTRAVTRNILNRSNALMDKENEPLRISTAVEDATPFLLHSVPNKGNCDTETHNEMSKTCNLPKKNFSASADMSMEITRAVPQNVLNIRRTIMDKGNCQIPNNQTAVNVNPKNVGRSFSKDPTTNMAVTNPVLDKENCPIILREMPSHGRNLFPEKISGDNDIVPLSSYIDLNSILNRDNRFLEKAASINKNEHQEYNKKRMAPTPVEKSCPSTCALGTSILTTSVPEPAIPNVINEKRTESKKTCSMLVFSETAQEAKQLEDPKNEENLENSGMVFEKLDAPESRENSLETSEMLFYKLGKAPGNQENSLQNSEMIFNELADDPEIRENSLESNQIFLQKSGEDLATINPPSFACVDDMECDDMGTNFAGVPVNKENNVNNMELSGTYGNNSFTDYNYQECNAVRNLDASAFNTEVIHGRQTLLPMHTSLVSDSICVGSEEEIQPVNAQALHLSYEDTTNINNSRNNSSIKEQIAETTSTPADCSTDLIDENVHAPLTHEYHDAFESYVRSEKFANTNEIQTLDTSWPTFNDSSNDPSIEQEISNELEESLRERVSIEKSINHLSENQNVSPTTVDILNISEAQTSMGEENMLDAQDPFAALSCKLKNMVENQEVIWNVFHVDPEKRLLVIGFVSCTLLVAIHLEDDPVDVTRFHVARIKLVSRLADQSDLLMRIGHRLIIEQVDPEALIRSFEEHRDFLQLLDDITSDVKLVLDFIIDFRRLEPLHLMTLSDDQFSFKVWTKRAEIVLIVTMKFKTFSQLQPSDVNVDCIIGAINEEDIKKLLRNVKRDHKFLRRFINDVKDYIYLMTDTNRNSKV